MDAALVDDAQVRHLPAALRCHAVWRAMAGTLAPPSRMREAAEQRARLTEHERAALDAYGRRCWQLFHERVYAAVDPARPGGAEEGVARRELAAALPWLDAWTLDTLWGTAFRLAMM